MNGTPNGATIHAESMLAVATHNAVYILINYSISCDEIAVHLGIGVDLHRFARQDIRCDRNSINMAIRFLRASIFDCYCLVTETDLLFAQASRNCSSQMDLAGMKSVCVRAR